MPLFVCDIGSIICSLVCDPTRWEQHRFRSCFCPKRNTLANNCNDTPGVSQASDFGIYPSQLKSIRPEMATYSSEVTTKDGVCEHARQTKVCVHCADWLNRGNGPFPSHDVV